MNANEYSTNKHIIEKVVEENSEKVNRLLTSTYISSDDFVDEFEEVLIAVDSLPPMDSNFMEWLRLDDPELAILLVNMTATALAIDASFRQIAPASYEEAQSFLA